MAARGFIPDMTPPGTAAIPPGKAPGSSAKPKAFGKKAVGKKPVQKKAPGGKRSFGGRR